MDELKYILKCLAFTILMVMLMQVKVGGRSVEAHLESFSRDSSASSFVQSVAAGGVMGLKQLYRSGKEMVSDTIHSVEKGSEAKAIK